jgi:hypothetical protein
MHLFAKHVTYFVGAETKNRTKGSGCASFGLIFDSDMSYREQGSVQSTTLLPETDTAAGIKYIFEPCRFSGRPFVGTGKAGHQAPERAVTTVNPLEATDDPDLYRI